MKIGNIETKNLKVEKLRKCTCKSKPILIPNEEGWYSMSCPNCEITTATYETDQEAFNAWENKILM